MLKQRVQTAVILLIVMLVMLYWVNAAIWAAFAGLMALLTLWEYGRICGMELRHLLSYLGGTAFFMLLAYLGDWQLPNLMWLITLLFWLVLMPLWLMKKWRVGRGGRAMIVGWLMVMPFWFALLTLRADNANTLLAVMLLVWIADCGAYFVGKAFGKHKLAPSISPGKSWEGAIGGLVAVFIYLMVAQSGLGLSMSGFMTMVFGVILTAVSIGGDLLESLLKRMAGVKDSSQLLPGHGGVFDRVDSLIAVVGVYAAVVVLCA